MKILEVEYKPVTKDGIPINLTYEENVGPFGSKLWKYDEIKAFIGNEEAGYIKIAYIPKKWLKNIFHLS